MARFLLGICEADTKMLLGEYTVLQAKRVHFAFYDKCEYINFIICLQ